MKTFWKKKTKKAELEPSTRPTYAFGSSIPRGLIMKPCPVASPRKRQNSPDESLMLSSRSVDSNEFGESKSNIDPRTRETFTTSTLFHPPLRYGASHWSVSLASTLITNTLSSEGDNHDWRHVYSDFDSSDECQVVIHNKLGINFLFCWVNGAGKLYHYYPIHDGSIHDASVSTSHCEFARIHHAFVGFRSNPTGERPEMLSQISNEDFLFIYKPKLPQRRHELTVLFTCNENQVDIDLNCQPIENDAVIDNVSKPYDQCDIYGFKVFYEPGLWEKIPELYQSLVEDFQMVCELLPPVALRKLQQDTPLWVNETLTFGRTSKPEKGRGSTFHPGKDWLRSNGLSEAKEGCVEMYDARGHLDSRRLWGPGGIMVHEYSHAYHNKHTDEGYSNPDIQQAYDHAMQCKLYDSVAVHGPQGIHGPQKAYACTNCMEYFAELSVAYHWSKDAVTEYNKWFPHNRTQLMQHDPRAAELLHRLWEQ